MDELALIDRPTAMDFILNMTGQPSVASVGHSQGCTLTIMNLAMRPEYIDKIWLLLLMGPVTHSEYIRTPFLTAQAKTGSAQVGGTWWCRGKGCAAGCAPRGARWRRVCPAAHALGQHPRRPTPQVPPAPCAYPPARTPPPPHTHPPPMHPPARPPAPRLSWATLAWASSSPTR